MHFLSNLISHVDVVVICHRLNESSDRGCLPAEESLHVTSVDFHHADAVSASRLTDVL